MFDKARTKGHVQLTMKKCKIYLKFCNLKYSEINEVYFIIYIFSLISFCGKVKANFRKKV